MFKSPEQVSRIFIMLGNDCNCNCNYCMQTKNNVLPIEINDDIFKFIEEQGKITLVFYGGEPLLHIDEIRLFLRKLRTKVDYSIITNGTLLTKEIVHLLNRYHFAVTVSWDGKNSIKTRNYDIVNDKKDLLLKIDNLTLSGVINKYTYPKDILTDIENLNVEYRKYHPNDIGYFIDNLYNFDNNTNELFNIDFNKLHSQMKEILKNYNNESSKNSMILNNYIDNVKSKCELNVLEIYSMCGNGIFTLNMDLQGNLYLCHNNYEKILGTIYSDTDEYMSKYKEYFNIQKRFMERCNNCKIKIFCKGGCILLDDSNLDNYCKQRMAMFDEFFDIYKRIIDIKELSSEM